MKNFLRDINWADDLLLQKLTTRWTIPFGMRKLLLVSKSGIKVELSIYSKCITIELHRKTITVNHYFIHIDEHSFREIRVIIPLSFKFR